MFKPETIDDAYFHTTFLLGFLKEQVEVIPVKDAKSYVEAVTYLENHLDAITSYMVADDQKTHLKLAQKTHLKLVNKGEE